MKKSAPIVLLVFVSISTMGMEHGFGRHMRFAHLRLTKNNQPQALRKTVSEQIDNRDEHTPNNLKRRNSAPAILTTKVLVNISALGEYNSDFGAEKSPTQVKKPDQMIELSKLQWKQYKQSLSGKVTDPAASNKTSNICTAKAKKTRASSSPQNTPNIEILHTAQLSGMNAGYTFFPFLSSLFNFK